MPICWKRLAWIPSLNWRQRNPQNLLEKMTAVNAEKKLVRRMPTLAQVQSWVEQAKGCPALSSTNPFYLSLRQPKRSRWATQEALAD